MNRTATLLILLLTLTTVRAQQQPIFSDFEVSQPAEPPGGMPALQRFMTINIRKPFLAQVANVKGMAIVQGVVEPDGHISEVSVARSLRPDCDREAVRAFALFNAWKPAQKDGKPVRQRVTFPVRFAANEPISYQNGVAIQYFDNAFRAITQPDSAVLRSETPTDTLGLPTGNLVFFKRQRKRWEKIKEINFTKTLIKNRQTPVGPLFIVGHLDESERPFGQTLIINEHGGVYNEWHYDVNGFLKLKVDRNNFQVVTETKQEQGGQTIIMSWYGNGQMKQEQVWPSTKSTKIYHPQMIAYWDSLGKQTVVDGNGYVSIRVRAISKLDTSRSTYFEEQGGYAEKVKQGTWKGQYGDGSYWYEEQYNKGELIAGKAKFFDIPDTVRYTVAEQQPEFIGGINGMTNFLNATLKYPLSAQRENVQGKVVVRFVIDTDGGVVDIEVLKGLGYGCNQEAVRVVQAMNGHWKPGLQRGRPVRVRYSLPINFGFH